MFLNFESRVSFSLALVFKDVISIGLGLILAGVPNMEQCYVYSVNREEVSILEKSLKNLDKKSNFRVKSKELRRRQSPHTENDFCFLVTTVSQNQAEQIACKRIYSKHKPVLNMNHCHKEVLNQRKQQVNQYFSDLMANVD